MRIPRLSQKVIQALQDPQTYVQLTLGWQLTTILTDLHKPHKRCPALR